MSEWETERKRRSKWEVRRQYLHKVLHVFYVGAQGQAAVRGVVLQQLRAAVLRRRRHVKVKGTREGGGGAPCRKRGC